MAQRIKGQDTIITIQKDGELQARIDAISDSEVTYELDILEEGYLGETSQRYDSIFNGMTFRMTAHMTNKQALELSEAIVARAQRRTGAAIRIDLALTLVYPNGDLVSIAVPDVHFQSIPISASSREDYISIGLEGKASEGQLL